MKRAGISSLVFMCIGLEISAKLPSVMMPEKDFEKFYKTCEKLLTNGDLSGIIAKLSRETRVSKRSADTQLDAVLP